MWSTSNFNATNPNWSQAYNGMSDVSVTSFDYWAVNGDDNNNQIIASTYGRGVFTGSFTATAVADTEAPSAPSNLTASNTTQNSTDLTWTASTDNVGVFRIRHITRWFSHSLCIWLNNHIIKLLD